MHVPLTISDFLDRGALVYPDRVAVVDEPSVASNLGSLSYGELAARGRGMAAALDDLGVPVGAVRRDREPEFGPDADRIFRGERLGTRPRANRFPPQRRRSGFHRRALGNRGPSRSILSSTSLWAVFRCGERIVLDGDADRALFAPLPAGCSPRGWDPDENATCSINYTSGTTARPKGVELTHRNCTLNAMAFGWHTGVNDRDVLLHTLPMFHCNGWGMPYAVTGMGVRHVVLRKVDGEEILARVEREGVTLMCGAPAVVAAVLDAAVARRETSSASGGVAAGTVPGAGRTRIVVAGAPPPSKVIERGRDGARVGIHPDLRSDRDRSAAHDQPCPARVGRHRRTGAGAGCSHGRGRRR